MGSLGSDPQVRLIHHRAHRSTFISDHNQPGDTFSGTLIQPVVVDGVVVAQRGETVYGRVAESQKARNGNSSRLGLELTQPDVGRWYASPGAVALVARQVPHPNGRTGRHCRHTTAIGAAVGRAAGLARSSHWGAGAGAAAGIVGVLLTRKPSDGPSTGTALNVQRNRRSRSTWHTPARPFGTRAGRIQSAHEAHLGPRPVPVAPGPGYYYGSGPATTVIVLLCPRSRSTLAEDPATSTERGYYRRWRYSVQWDRRSLPKSSVSLPGRV